jgi:hypothetical protein
LFNAGDGVKHAAAGSGMSYLAGGTFTLQQVYGDAQLSRGFGFG